MNPILIVAIIGGFALLLLIAGGIAMMADRRAVVDERMGRYAASSTMAATPGPEDAVRASPLGERLDRALAGRGWADRIHTQLARADLSLNAGEYLALIVISTVGTGAVLAMLRGLFPGGVLGAIGGFFLPRIYLRVRQNSRLKKFDEQLSDMINLTVNGLRAGYSPMQALESVGEEMPPPISTEFRRVVLEMQLGITMEVALDNLLRRINSPDLDLMVTAINVQREVGGNLADILETISHTIRERVRIKGEIRVITSQQRFTSFFLSGMPFALAGLLLLVNPSYLKDVFDPEFPEYHIVGIAMGVVALLLIGAGFLVMRKIVDIEV